jgi:hypothetical protein
MSASVCVHSAFVSLREFFAFRRLFLFFEFFSRLFLFIAVFLVFVSQVTTWWLGGGVGEKKGAWQ